MTRGLNNAVSSVSITDKIPCLFVPSTLVSCVISLCENAISRSLISSQFKRNFRGWKNVRLLKKAARWTHRSIILPTMVGRAVFSLLIYSLIGVGVW